MLVLAMLSLGTAANRAPVVAQQAEPPVTQPAARSPGGGWSAEVTPRQPAARRTRATSIRASGDEARTQVRMEVSRPIVASMFTLDQPYRAIVDVADLDFNVPAGTGTRGAGLVKAFRYGQFEEGRSRVVIDLNGPATIENASFTAPAGKGPGVLSFELVRVAAADFRAMRGPSAPETEPLSAKQPLRSSRHEESNPGPTAGASRKTLPVVVIDPGHGGIDPGTVAPTGITEKAVTLAVALQVRNILLQSRRYDVRLTRQSDTFVSLDQRVSLSRQHQADLFVSIHADALAERDLAQSVRGATIYILSDRASDDISRRLAEKENAADIVAGLAAHQVPAEDLVRNILLDLVQRETANYAVTFRNLLHSQMKGKVPLAKDPLRSAAFKVLKQADTPAVLVELGYMSNAEDLARLIKADGQRTLASAIAASIEAYFGKRDEQLNRTTGP